MPVRNGARWLTAAIESVLGQTVTDLELLVVDDGSDDTTPEILFSASRRDARVRVIRTEPLGLVAALNRGIAEARAPLIARLDADDIALPQRLARQVAEMRDRPRLELLGSCAEIIGADGETKGRMRRPSHHKVLVRTLETENPFIHSSVVFRTSTARCLGGYRAAFLAAEDYEFWIRLSEVGEIDNLSDALVQYRQHGDGVTRTRQVRQVFSVRLARAAHAMRRNGAGDPAEGLTDPPDWFASEADSAFYARDAGLCRFLALSEPSQMTAAHLARIDFKEFQRAMPSLTRGERRLALAAAINLISSRGFTLPASRFRLARLMLHLNPVRAISALPRLLFQQNASVGSARVGVE